MGVIKAFAKTVIERRRLYVDYDCWLADNEQLTDLDITIDPITADAPLIVDQGYPDAEMRRLVFYVSEGKANTSYTMQMVVTTTEGQVKRDDIGMRVLP